MPVSDSPIVSMPLRNLRQLAIEALVAESLAEAALNELLPTLGPAQLASLAALLDARDRHERALREIAGELLHSGVTWDEILRSVFYSFEAVEELAVRGQADAHRQQQQGGAPTTVATIASSVFEHAEIAIVIYAADGTLLGMNEANRKMAGVPSREHGVGMFNVLTDRLPRANGMSVALGPAFEGAIVHNPRIRIAWDLPENRYGLPRRDSYYDDLAVPIREVGGRVIGVARFTRELVV